MPFKVFLPLGLVLAIPLIIGARVEAEGGILSRLHHHHSSGHPVEHDVVRIPGREIRIETARPHVIVKEHAGASRIRGFLPPGPAFLPITQGPFVATFLPPTVNLSTTVCAPAGNPAIRAMHELEIQAAEVNRLRAAQKADLEHFERVHQRIQANFSSSLQSSGSTSELAELKKSIDALTKRVSDIERLLVIHDNILKEVPPILKK